MNETMDQIQNVFIIGGVVLGFYCLLLLWSHWRTRRVIERILERSARSDLERRLAAVERGLDQIKSERTRPGHL
jgi:hypothetical protein